MESTTPDLSGQVAVITGASKGLGRHLAVAMAERGAGVVVFGRDGDGLAETVRRAGDDALAVTGDVSVPAEVAALAGRTLERFGPPSILVNAAGTFGPIALVHESEPADWIETQLTNTVGPYLTVHAFVEGMIDGGWGRIVNVSSAAPLYPPGPVNSAYSTSKAALNQFTRHLAAELEGTGVTANVLHPGSLKTAMWDDIRVKVQTAGPGADTLREWVAMVDRTGGDPVDHTVSLVLSLLEPDSTVNGEFCWPEGMIISEPLPSW